MNFIIAFSKIDSISCSVSLTVYFDCEYFSLWIYLARSRFIFSLILLFRSSSSFSLVLASLSSLSLSSSLLLLLLSLSLSLASPSIIAASFMLPGAVSSGVLLPVEEEEEELLLLEVDSFKVHYLAE